MKTDNFNAQHASAYDAAIEITAKNISAIPVALISDLHALDNTGAKAAADRDAWALIQKGLQHLKDGGPDKKPGMLSEALKKASLRSSPLASSINIPPPQFQPLFTTKTHKTGHETAVAEIVRFIEFLEEDIPKSSRMIETRLSSTPISPAFGETSGMADPALLKVLRSIPQANDFAELADSASQNNEKSLHDFKEQTVLALRSLTESFAAACQRFKIDVQSLPGMQDHQSPRPKM